MGKSRKTYTAGSFFSSLAEADRPAQSPDEMREVLRDYQAMLKA
jgi:hypothetical protein